MIRKKIKSLLPRIKGGAEKKAFNKKGIVPVNFSSEDPFWDFGAIFTNIESAIRNGEIEDLIVITRGKKGVLPIWRGMNTLTVALGMLTYAAIDLHRAKVEQPNDN